MHGVSLAVISIPPQLACVSELQPGYSHIPMTMAGLIHHFPTKVLFAVVLAARDADDHTRLHSMLGDEPTGLQVLDAFVATAHLTYRPGSESCL